MNSSDYLRNSVWEYARYTIEQRAIPHLTDGLKSSQRIALWLMHNQSKAVKTMGLVGDMMKSGLYVHGDASAAGTISRLAAPFVNNYCLLLGEGTFGTRVYPVSGIGAPRYTEVRRSKFSEDHLFIDLDIAEMVENFDAGTSMPKTFLPRLPLILLNGVNGLAIGFANSIQPRNLDDVKKAVLEVLSKGETTQPLLPHYERYDCRVVRDPKNPLKFYISGKLKIMNTTTVHITEIPPAIDVQKFRERLMQMEEDKKIVGFEDNSTDRISITVKMTRAALQGKSEQQLIQFFRLTDTQTENLTVLDPSGSTIMVYKNAQDLVKDFVAWRLTLYKTRYETMLTKETDNNLFWKSFLACFDSRSGGRRSVAASVSGIKSKADLRDAVIEAITAQDLECRDAIVERISSQPVYRFTQEGQKLAKDHIRDSDKLVSQYTEIINNPKKLKRVYQDEVKQH